MDWTCWCKVQLMMNMGISPKPIIRLFFTCRLTVKKYDVYFFLNKVIKLI